MDGITQSIDGVWKKLITFFNLTFQFVYGKIASHHKFNRINVGNLKRAQSYLSPFGKETRNYSSKCIQLQEWETRNYQSRFH